MQARTKLLLSIHSSVPLFQKSESTAHQTKQLPRWLLWWAAQRTLWASMQARTKQLLSIHSYVPLLQKSEV
jgi:hypothetical protein